MSTLYITLRIKGMLYYPACLEEGICHVLNGLWRGQCGMKLQVVPS